MTPDIEKNLTELGQALGSDDSIVKNVMSRIEGKKIESPQQTYNVWRIIMKSKMIKFAAAAVIIIVAMVVITLLDKTVTPAWAIEDTIKALENICSIKMHGISSGTTAEGKCIEVSFVLWAKPNEDNTETGELRLEVPDFQTTVVTPSGKTYMYKKSENAVSITESKTFFISPWLGSNFFNSIKEFADNWQISYGKDEETGRESIFVTCQHPTEPKSWWFQFDYETKLPVKFKQWTNSTLEGLPQAYVTSIEYNPELPDGIFEFKIPDGAKVTVVPMKLPEYFDDPNVGISTEGFTDEEASLEIVKDYWRAVIDGDWEYLAKLRPICGAKEWESKFKHNDSWPKEVLELGQPSQNENCKIGPIVACTVKYSDGQIKTISLIVKFREIAGNKSCVIAGTFGVTKDFDR